MLAPLPVVLPLIAAVLLLSLERRLPEAAVEVAAMLTAVTTAVLAGVLTAASLHRPIVYWFGGWQPHAGVALGIDFAIDPAGAAVACFTDGLFAATLLFGWRYFDDTHAHFHALMLIFMAAIDGLCLTGDLFDFFVFFELMGVAAFAVTAYTREADSIEGALNFTVMNMIGGFLILLGITLLYGTSGALNFAQIGRAVAAMHGGTLVELAFVLLMSGLLIKAAAMPFHFWLADAHAVAPTPVCVIFSGIMVSIALFGVMRIYWTVFASVAAIGAVVHGLLLHLGVVTAVVGGLACLAQRHVKRLLAFSTVSHIGVMLTGVALLTPGGTAGVLLYLVGHGLVKGALFMTAGILMSAYGDIDEMALRGRARDMPVTGVACVLGGLLLAGLPTGLLADGRAAIDQALDPGHAWVPYALTLGSALTGAAVLRVAGRVFLGLGPTPSGVAARGRPRQEKPRPSTLLLAPLLALLAACLLVPPSLARGFAARAAAVMTDRTGYAALVLDHRPSSAAAATLAYAGPLLGWIGCILALVVAAWQLHPAMVPGPPRRGAAMIAAWIGKGLDRLHSGHIGDYVVWAMLGLALFGNAFLW